jgi:DNA-binding NarL/FixJ family response regulator
MNLKIGITDDHALFRKSLKLLINSFQGMEVTLEAANGAELLEKLKNNPIDVLLLDLQMPKMDGITTSEKVSNLYPEIKILILTQLAGKESIKKILNLKIQGYYTKNTDPQELKSAILKLSENGFYFEKNLKSIINDIKDNFEEGINKKEIKIFSKREMQILKLTIAEFSGIEIADKLNISPKTVEKHKQNLMKKTNSKNFIGVIKYALIHDFLSIEDI